MEAHDGFAARLKDATAEVHDAAERSALMGRIVNGEATLGEYARLIGQYFFIYQALEEVAEVMTHDPVAGQFIDPGLVRLPALRADLAHLLGENWATEISATPATAAYAARIREVGSSWPGGFVAHHYVRYLGDLSGGQILRRILARVFSMDEGAGLSFYVFDEIDNGVQLKKRYRQLLDEAPWDATEQDRIAAEAVRAFAFNTEVFASLDTSATAVVADH